eukprot:g13441.t1
MAYFQGYNKAQHVRMNLKISIQALSGLDATCEAPPGSMPARRSSSPRHRPSSSSDGRSVKTSNFSNFRALSDFSPEAETPGRGTPGGRSFSPRRYLDPMGMRRTSTSASIGLDFRRPRRTGWGRRLDVFRAHPPVQEALEALMLKLRRRAREPAPSCGLLFTAVPHSAPREATLDAEEAQEAAAKAKKEAEAVLPPSLYSSPLYLDLDAEDPEARLARPLQELENHLTSIRSRVNGARRDP